MPEGLLHLISRRPLVDIAVDVVDLLVVTWLIYRALLVLRGTRAFQMGIGLGVIALIYLLAERLRLVTLFSVLSTLLTSIILIVVVVFQNDIRRALMRVGAPAFFGGFGQQRESRVIDEVAGAATELARHRIGALICFEQDANLDEFVVGHGTDLDANVQRDLLVGLFIPEAYNKLHDGAVVIRNLRIAKAGVFFPMPDTKVLDKSLGSRHRAALGITEETDALVIVVSEERGTISLCVGGNIVPNLDGTTLRPTLEGLIGQSSRAKKKPAAPLSTRRPPISGPVRPSQSGAAPIAPAPPRPQKPEPPRSESMSIPLGDPPEPRPMAPAKPVEPPSIPALPDDDR